MFSQIILRYALFFLLIFSHEKIFAQDESHCSNSECSKAFKGFLVASAMLGATFAPRYILAKEYRSTYASSGFSMIFGGAFNNFFQMSVDLEKLHPSKTGFGLHTSLQARTVSNGEAEFLQKTNAEYGFLKVKNWNLTGEAGLAYLIKTTDGSSALGISTRLSSESSFVFWGLRISTEYFNSFRGDQEVLIAVDGFSIPQRADRSTFGFGLGLILQPEEFTCLLRLTIGL